ncbi:MAG TPA: hypothetical protein PK491_02980 [Candidatus Hydrogenedentes bacterium]|nr:hypothetical protein [Candidatus Hydrogenedentota bacterium]
MVGQCLESGVIYRAYASCAVESETGYAGGIVGLCNTGWITTCSFRGTVEGEISGGVAGHMENSLCEDRWSNGTISGRRAAGGLIGHATSLDDEPCIKNCYSSATVEKKLSSGTLGGLVAWAGDEVVAKHSYWCIDTAGTEDSAVGEARTLSEMTRPSAFNTYVDWNFSDIWVEDYLGENDGFPIFSDRTANENYSGGSGTLDNPYLISQVRDWLKLLESPYDWDKHFLLIADLDFKDASIEPLGDWETNKGFSGNLNGYGHCFENLQITAPLESHAGLFAGLENATIYNLCLKNVRTAAAQSAGTLAGYAIDSDISFCKATGTATAGSHAGGLVGYSLRSRFYRCETSVRVQGYMSAGGMTGYAEQNTQFQYCATTENATALYAGGIAGFVTDSGLFTECRTTGNLFGVLMDGQDPALATHAGGIAGFCMNNIEFANCHSSGNSTGDRAGGIAGYCHSAPVFTQCSTSGSINGTGEPSTGGGIVAACGDNVTISQCYSLASVNAAYAGGIAAVLDGGFSSNNCYDRGTAAGTVYAGGLGAVLYNGTIRNSYSTARVSLPTKSEGAGGLAGLIDNVTVEASYWDAERSGIDSSPVGTAKTTEDMTYPYATDCYESWDFSTVWTADSEMINHGYPWLSDLPPDPEEMPSEYSGGTGLSDDPYLISTVEDWLALCRTPRDWHRHFAVTDDLDFNGVTMPMAGTWTTPFTGSLDGRKHSFRNISMGVIDEEYAALFPIFQGGFIKDLDLIDISVMKCDHGAGFAYVLENATISGCTV